MRSTPDTGAGRLHPARVAASHFCPLPCRSRLPRYKYQVWQDSRLGRQKMVRDGLETVLTLVPGEPLG